MKALTWRLSKTHSGYTLPRIRADYDCEPSGACRPGPPSDPATQKDTTAQVTSRYDPSDLTKEIGLKDANKTKGRVHDELLKNIMYVPPKRGQQLPETSIEVMGAWARRPGPLL